MEYQTSKCHIIKLDISTPFDFKSMLLKALFETRFGFPYVYKLPLIIKLIYTQAIR